MAEGFARCVDWSLATVTGGAEKLRAAEKAAKEKKVRMWKNYTPSAAQVTIYFRTVKVPYKHVCIFTLKVNVKDKQFSGKVVEIVNADALNIKLNDGSIKKIFLASIRPPRYFACSKRN